MTKKFFLSAMIATFAVYNGSINGMQVYPINLKELYALQYEDVHVETLLRYLVKQKQDITKIVLTEFMQFIKVEIELKQIREEYPDLSSQYKEKDSLKNAIQDYIKQILSTHSGRFLICSLLTLMHQNSGHISFKLAKKGEGISTKNGVIYLDLNHFISDTDFYVYDPGNFGVKAEKEALPDVYLFHELLHYKHYLENTKAFEALSIGIIPDNFSYFNADCENWQADYPGTGGKSDLEEMRTIIGVPYDCRNQYILCENSYRSERKLLPRMNILDASTETSPTDNHYKILRLIEKSKELFPTLKK